MISRCVSPSRLAALCAAAGARHGVPVRVILSRDRAWPTCAARREVICALDAAGFGPLAIGRALGRHHATVLHNLRRAGDGR